MSIVFYLVRGVFGGLAVAAVQLLLAMLIRSFAVPIFLGLVGGIAGMLIGNKGYALLWPYCLMQQGMNANRSTDVLGPGNVLPFFAGVCGLAGGGAFDRKSAAGKNGCESVMFYRAAGAAYRRPGGIWRVGICGRAPGRSCPAPTASPYISACETPCPAV